ncbi:MAG: hypothetical protein SGI87_00800 [Flavobacteriales bacterium]|nr:hypothetical protein [Flavobacteriales bacterium]
MKTTILFFFILSLLHVAIALAQNNHCPADQLLNFQLNSPEMQELFLEEEKN